MARCYSLSTMLHKVPKDLLREYFLKVVGSDLRDRNIVLIFDHLVEFMRLKQELLKENFLGKKPYTLLPCPRQKEIAIATGKKEPTVSKCLKDPKAESLQLLWKMAQSEDVEECLRFMVPSARLSDIHRYGDAMLDEIGE